MYHVPLTNLNQQVLQRAKDFAIGVVDQTHDRFNYNYNRRVETIYIGKLAEEVFIHFAANELGVQLESNYNIYEGTQNVDENDFIINGIDIDIKSSKDTKNDGLNSCYNRFNFPVPTDQTIKDITLSIIYDFHVQNFHLVSWIDSDTYSRNATIRQLPVGNGEWREFYLYPLRKGNSITTLKNYLGI